MLHLRSELGLKVVKFEMEDGVLPPGVKNQGSRSWPVR